MYKKLLGLILLIFIVSAGLMGCGDGLSVSKPKDVGKIELLKLDGFTLSNATVLKTFTEDEEIKRILSVIKDSEQIQGVLDIMAPNHALRIFKKDDNTEAFYLWTEFDSGRYSGIVMDVQNTHIGYTLKEDAAKYLHNLIHD